MRLNKLAIDGFKNLNSFELDFKGKDGLTVLIGNNASGKSNILEAISAIFAGLYSQKQKPTFDYSIIYKIKDNDVAIKFHDRKYSFNVNGKNISESEFSLKAEDYLPSQVIAAYSGEETRLWENHYKPFYLDFIDNIKKPELPSIPHQKMFYVNKYYWNIALLTFLLSELPGIKEFCAKTLNISKINDIEFFFNTKEIGRYKSNPVVSFVKSLNPHNKETISITLDELKALVPGYEKDFFKNLTAAYMPKDSKLITDIRIKFNDHLTTASLSEGEKKLILVKLVLEFLSDENSLLLLDEPDSHLHISRKEALKELLEEYENRENVITTHSPTLTHCLGIKHIVMLSKDGGNNVRVESKDKQEIIAQLTDGIWSYQEQNIFLNSNNDILLVEGKSDETFLKKALEVLKTKPKYKNLKFEYLPCGGADGVKLMTQKFKPKAGQHIVAFFDSDEAGWKAINKVFERDKQNKYDTQNFGAYRKKEGTWIAVYPKRPYYRGGSNFNIEDYFSKKTLNEYVLKNFKGLDTLISKDKFKKSLEESCKDFSDEEFKYFKLVFDLILEIKAKE